MDEILLEDRSDGAVRLALNRPGSANSLNLELATDLRDALVRSVQERASLVVLEGTGRFFSAGGDLKAMQAAGDRGSYARNLADTLHEGLEVIANSTTLFVTVVRGMAAGAGLGIVLQSDFCVCSRDARFRASYNSAGLTPDMGLTYLLPRSVGEIRARYMLTLDPTIDGAKAAEWGLVADAVPADDVDDRLKEVIALYEGSVAAGETKRLMAAARQQTLSMQLGAEAASISALIGGEDAQRRIGAFVASSRGTSA